MTAPAKPNRRQLAKARTRQKVVDAARCIFVAKSYEGSTIRDIAREAGMSTGAIFANFKDKAELWRAVMKSEPPLDSALTRAAPALLKGAKGLVVMITTRPDVLAALRPLMTETDLANLSVAGEAIAQAEGHA